jgi:hypothetical protein
MPLLRSKISSVVSRLQSASCEALEPRRLLSGNTAISKQSLPAPTDNFVILQSELATADGYSSPSGAPITPDKMRGAYGLGNYNASNITFNGVQGTGAGQTIALIENGDDPDIAADLTAFDNYWDLPAPPSLMQLNDTGGTTLPGVGAIGELDLDVEWAHVMAPQASLVIYCGNLYTGMSTAAAATGVSVISVSFTISGTEGVREFETPSGHNGVTFCAAAGDSGGEVNDPAKSPAVVAVGGTDLTTSGNNYSSEAGWSSGGGGINGSESQPAYQNGIVSAFSTTYRTIPDVALDADPGTGVAVYDEYDNGTADPWSAIVGGTSLATPLMAGIVAVADQGRVAAGLTSMDGYTQTLPRLYGLYTADYSANFHDITAGNNGHAAGVGYDLVTGLGSPIGNKLIPDLAGADTVTGRVFLDASGNGVYGGTDTPMAGETVYLDVNGTGVQTSTDPTATTNSSGIYTFSDQIGSESGVVRLVSLPAGDLHSTTANNFATSYDQTQTINIGFYASTYVAAASPATVTGTTTSLSITGAGPADASSFIYTWASTSAPDGASPIFSANGTNAAQNNSVTFNKVGSYTFTVTIDDGQGGTVTSSVNVTVGSTFTKINVLPSASNVYDGQAVQFSAVGLDQFGNALASQPSFTWSIANGSAGNLSSSGFYTAPVSGPGSGTVTATSGSLTASGTVTTTLSIIDGTAGNDAIRLVRSGANLAVYINNNSNPAYTVAYSPLLAVTINTLAGNDSVNIDFSGGATPVPTGGLNVNGGGGTDTLTIIGTTGNDAATINATSFALNASSIYYSAIKSIVFNGDGGSDILTQTAQPDNSASLAFNATTTGGTSASDSLNISGGVYTFAPPVTGSGIAPIPLSSLSVSANASVIVGSAASHGDRWVMSLGALSLTSNSQLNLGNNDLIVHNASLSKITSEIGTGYANGFWNGPGIASSAAATDTKHLTALGVILNNNGAGGALHTTFDNQPL